MMQKFRGWDKEKKRWMTKEIENEEESEKAEEKKRLIRKKRKKIIDEHPEYGPRGFVCKNCGRKMDVLNEYQWKYEFCNVNCGNELFGVGYGQLFKERKIEVKKGKKWLKKEFDDLFNGKTILTVGRSVVDEILDQLDEPETLSIDKEQLIKKIENYIPLHDKTVGDVVDGILEIIKQLPELEVLSPDWIDKNQHPYGGDYQVPSEKLEDLLVPNLEEVDRAYKDGYEEGREHGFYKGYREGLADKGGEPEVLSQEWIEQNHFETENVLEDLYISDGETIDYTPHIKVIAVQDLQKQNLIAPKQELPTIPKFVAEFLIGKEDYMLYELFDDEWLYEEHNRVAKWLYDNDELTNKQREIDLVMARDRSYRVEEEQKYRVIDSHKVYLLARDEDRNEVETVAKLIEIYGYNHAELDYNLTEQEIKDYDERYWSFRKPVEELEE